MLAGKKKNKLFFFSYADQFELQANSLASYAIWLS